MADAVAINKADKSNIEASKRAKAEYQTALHYLPPSSSMWQPKVHTCSALENEGIKEIWSTIEEYISKTRDNDWLKNERARQNLHWMHEKLNFLLKEQLYSQSEFKVEFKTIEEQVAANEISPTSGAQKLIEMLR